MLLVTGKGGTGKTTLAAATAVHVADTGAHTLVVSTDGAHSLGDVLGRRLRSEPEAVTATLSAQEINAQALLDSSWTTICSYIEQILEWAGVDTLQAGELAVVPGLEELLALGAVGRQAKGDWDVVVVDCAPTAETVRLLALPATLDYYIGKVLPSHRRLARSVAPLLRRTPAMPPAPTGVLDAALHLAGQIAALHQVLTDPAVTTTRLVTTPESLVISETQRAWGYLSLFGHLVDSVIVNRVAPCETDDTWLSRCSAAQRPHLERIDDQFGVLVRAHAPISPTEIVGIDALRAFAAEVYGDGDALAPAPDGHCDRATTESPQNFSLPLPGLQRDDVQLAQVGSSLLVTAGPYRRAVDLPDEFRDRGAIGAQVVNGRLEVEFAIS